MFEKYNPTKILLKIKGSIYAVPILLFVIGLVLLFIFSDKQAVKTEPKTTDGLSYVAKLEKNLEKSITAMSEVEDCTVMISVSSLAERKYLENTTVDSSLDGQNEEYTRQKEYLVIESGGDDSVIVQSELMPSICGALVVYNGKGDIHTEKKILDAVSTLLGVRSNQVCVISN